MTNQEKPKIIVDDDWKSQVQQEKEQLKKQMEEQPQPSADEAYASIPPASFGMLITTMASQALANLGQIPDPIEGKPVVRKPLAKHFIDTLAMLEDKTKNNLSDDEAEMLSGTLHQLRMVFVATPDSAANDEQKPEKPPSTIEIPD